MSPVDFKSELKVADNECGGGVIYGHDNAEMKKENQAEMKEEAVKAKLNISNQPSSTT